MESSLKRGLFLSGGLHVLFFLALWLLNLQPAQKIQEQSMDISMLTEVDTLAQGITEPVPPVEKIKPEIPKKAQKPAEKPADKDKSAKDKVNKDKSADKDTVKQTVAKNTEGDVAMEKKRKAEEEARKAEALKAEEERKKKEAEEKARAEALEKERKNKELNDIAGNLDKALDEEGEESKTGPGSVSANDPLSGARWTAKPRKTLYFPDIQSKIPEKYKKKGLGYSVTARIVFDKNGLAIRVDIVNSSGDPTIDGIFFTELRKVRVEPIQTSRLDEITKTFTISLR